MSDVLDLNRKLYGRELCYVTGIIPGIRELEDEVAAARSAIRKLCKYVDPLPKEVVEYMSTWEEE